MREWVRVIIYDLTYIYVFAGGVKCSSKVSFPKRIRAVA